MFNLDASSKPYLLMNVGPMGWNLLGLRPHVSSLLYSPAYALLTSMAPVDFYRLLSTKNGAIILLFLLDLF